LGGEALKGRSEIVVNKKKIQKIWARSFKRGVFGRKEKAHSGSIGEKKKEDDQCCMKKQERREALVTPGKKEESRRRRIRRR